MPAEISVIVPTVGRAALLRQCLQSIAACEPTPAEVLIVDQSGSEEVAALASEIDRLNVRYVRCDGTGKSLGANLGMREAAHDIVLFTDDDCTVASTWVEKALEALDQHPGAIVTGRVLQPEGSGDVPSIIDSLEPREYTGEVRCDALYWGNMAGSRTALLAMGGFDERLTLAAADNDLCHRWLRSGARLVYVPELVVWHHDWRTPDQLESLYARYARGQGIFYAKHLRKGDAMILRYLSRHFVWVARAELARIRHRRPRLPEWSPSVLVHLFRGLADGWRQLR